MIGATNGMMFGGMIVWLLWFALMLVAFFAFLRGMNALTRIADRLANIERILMTRETDV